MRILFNNKYKTFICFILLVSIVKGFASDGDKIRGLWVVRHSIVSQESIDNLIEFARKLKITDLFVQVRGRGDAYYLSKYEPLARELQNMNFDPLKYLLLKANLFAIRVHAWLNVFYVWSRDSLPTEKNHIVNREKGWIARSLRQKDLLRDYPNSIKKEGIEGLYLSPLHPEVQKYFLKIIKDIINNYNVDGIHLDYIRFPGSDFDLNPEVIKGFRHRYAINPLQFLENPENFAKKFSMEGYESFFFHWRKYLMDGLSDYIAQISKLIKTKNNNLILSAAVKPDMAIARWEYYQDWNRWVNENWIDYAIPMNYSPDSSIFVTRLETYHRKLPTNRYVVGIALYNQSEEQTIRKISQVLALNDKGFVLFSYRQLCQKKLVQKFLLKLAN